MTDVLALHDGRPGNNTQVLGVAEALGMPFEVLTLGETRWASLPNIVRGRSLIGYDAETQIALRAAMPKIVIGAGRRMAPAVRYIRGRTSAFSCQMMWPESGINDFDLIAVPGHDQKNGKNIITTLGAPHRVTLGKIEGASEGLRASCDVLPGPRIVVLIGGTSRHAIFSNADAKQLSDRLFSLAKETGGSLLVTTSRRTGESQTQAIQEAIKNVPHVFYPWGQGGDNPYPGLLGFADYIVVTEDSVAMMSEASCTGRPIYVYQYDKKKSFTHFLAPWEASGVARPLGDTLEEWFYRAPHTAQDVATAVKARL